jgi:16S rRNA processing protein RimM
MNLIGKIRSLHGVNGQLMLEHKMNASFDFTKLEALMIELLPGSYIPFFIEEANEINDNQVIIKLEEYNDRNTAIEILNKNVYAPPGVEISKIDDNPWLILIGFMLKNQEGLDVGIISDIMMNTSQILLEVKDETKEHLIPFSEELVIDINQQKKMLTLEIADGLLDI